MRDFFRFSIREFLVLVICFAVCVAGNRNSALAQIPLPALVDFTYFIAPPIGLAVVCILIHQVRNRPRPPAR